MEHKTSRLTGTMSEVATPYDQIVSLVQTIGEQVTLINGKTTGKVDFLVGGIPTSTRTLDKPQSTGGFLGETINRLQDISRTLDDINELLNAI